MTVDEDIGIRTAQEFLGEDAQADRISSGSNNEQYVFLEEAEFETALSHLVCKQVCSDKPLLLRRFLFEFSTLALLRV